MASCKFPGSLGFQSHTIFSIDSDVMMSTNLPSDKSSTTESSPSMVMLQMIGGTWLSQLIYAAAKLGIADLLKDGPKSSEKLAISSGTHASSLYRALRALSSYGIFKEVEPNCFGLTPLAETLQSGVPGSIRNMAITCGDEYYYYPFGKILYTLQTGKSAFHHFHGIGIFEYLMQHSDSGKCFDEAMTDYVSQMHISFAAAYDFSGVKKVVDVGGGHGTLIKSILKANPAVTGILFDRPSVIEGSSKSIEAAGLAERCEVVGGDFFESLPSGGDVYILSSIIHGWNNEDSARILRNCHRAMVNNGRLLLGELVIPTGNEPFFGKIHDINLMIAGDSGQERTENDFRKLYDMSGFKLTRIIPTQSLGSIVEGVRV
ncbi:acetylserotonin O-methyltransferase [Nostoc sp. CHAB 5784]|uniref:acetylserotonin O-methyltransferase n=1 Tax=Nostoc mirabile TaxID=2907820 RepID=UPI001E342E07|nr:acetylserotonin O-methyltransferase [Nostoc mirabile]MCC5669506.1 acetylserotonin O-methyltransferase [Nostoc mirabile CHAB5784]